MNITALFSHSSEWYENKKKEVAAMLPGFPRQDILIRNSSTSLTPINPLTAKERHFLKSRGWKWESKEWRLVARDDIGV